MEVAGQIRSLKRVGNWARALVADERGEFVAVGEALAQAQEGARYRFGGSWTDHPKHGRQFSVAGLLSEVERAEESAANRVDVHALARTIESSFSGAGAKTAAAIIDWAVKEPGGVAVLARMLAHEPWLLETRGPGAGKIKHLDEESADAGAWAVKRLTSYLAHELNVRWAKADMLARWAVQRRAYLASAGHDLLAAAQSDLVADPWLPAHTLQDWSEEEASAMARRASKAGGLDEAALLAQKAAVLKEALHWGTLGGSTTVRCPAGSAAESLALERYAADNRLNLARIETSELVVWAQASTSHVARRSAQMLHSLSRPGGVIERGWRGIASLAASRVASASEVAIASYTCDEFVALVSGRQSRLHLAQSASWEMLIGACAALMKAAAKGVVVTASSGVVAHWANKALQASGGRCLRLSDILEARGQRYGRNRSKPIEASVVVVLDAHSMTEVECAALLDALSPWADLVMMGSTHKSRKDSSGPWVSLTRTKEVFGLQIDASKQAGLKLAPCHGETAHALVEKAVGEWAKAVVKYGIENVLWVAPRSVLSRDPLGAQALNQGVSQSLLGHGGQGLRAGDQVWARRAVWAKLTGHRAPQELMMAGERALVIAAEKTSIDVQLGCGRKVTIPAECMERLELGYVLPLHAAHSHHVDCVVAIDSPLAAFDADGWKLLHSLPRLELVLIGGSHRGQSERESTSVGRHKNNVFVPPQAEQAHAAHTAAARVPGALEAHLQILSSRAAQTNKQGI